MYLYTLIWAYDQQADGGPFCVTGSLTACMSLKAFLSIYSKLSYILIRNNMDGSEVK